MAEDAKKAEEKGNGKAAVKETKAETAPANRLPLFYKNPVPLDGEKHKKLGLVENFGLGYASKVNAVPINMIEMPQICHCYPIAFSPDQNATPVALLGLRNDENLFVDENGQWENDLYIPAYIRRYPFIFSEVPESDQLTLCIDMDDSVVSEDSPQKFFEDDGAPTTLTQNALEFCKSYHAAAQQTMEFSKKLADSGLLIERQAEVTTKDNQKISFSGFRIVDEQKLSEIDDKEFIEWRQKGWLPFLYAHLFSGAQWQRLTRQINERL